MSARKILVIDDSSYEICPYVKTCVEILQGKPLFARDTGNAISIAEEEKPEAILLDVSTAEAFGRELARSLKDHPSTVHIPVTVLTHGDEDEKIADEARRQNYPCLSKRLPPQDFINRLQALLPQQQSG